MSWLTTKTGYNVTVDSMWILEDDSLIELAHNRS